MKRETIKVGSRDITDYQVKVEVDRAETTDDVLSIVGGEQEDVVNAGMRAINIKRQDAWLRPAFVEGWTKGLRNKELDAYVQQVADDEMDLTEKGRAGRPRKPPTVVFAAGELPEEGENLSRDEVLALFAAKGINVKQAK